MDDSLILEYKKLKIREKKLIQEGKKLQKEHDENVKYFIKHHISDKKWQNNLEKDACNLASALITMKIAKMKIKEIQSILFKKGVKNE